MAQISIISTLVCFWFYPRYFNNKLIITIMVVINLIINE